MDVSADAPVWNPFDPAYRSDPYPLLDRLRKENPTHVSAFGWPVFTRHADCIDVLRHPAASSDGRKAQRYQDALAAGEVTDEGSPPFLVLDPPDHTRLRGLVGKAFTPRVVDALRPRVEAMVGALIAPAIGRAEMEVVGELAYPLPVTVISEMLGVPAEDHDRFAGWSADLARSLDPDELLPPEFIARRDQASKEFRAWFLDLIALRRRHPGDDLLSALIRVEEAGDQLSEEELLSTAVLLLVAGHETTVNLIANGVLAFARHPDQWERLRADPAALMRTAVDEVLRFDPPVQIDSRGFLEGVTIGGIDVPAGDQVILLLGAANRDQDVFSDPGRFDVGRTDNKHLSFGFGIHHCLGAPLARMEGAVAFAALARSVERFDIVEDPPYRENLVLRGVESLRVRLTLN